jgi:hypothetical protein
VWLPWSDSTVARGIYARCASKNKHDGYAPPWRPALTPPSWIDLRDQKFESGFLQRRVNNACKKLEPSAETLLGMLYRWRDEAVRAGSNITRIALAFEAIVRPAPSLSVSQ